MLGDIDFGLVDSHRGGFFPDALDVFRFIGDIGDVDVQKRQADLMQFRLDVLFDRFQETLAVLVDLFNPQRGDSQAQLADDDFRGHRFDSFMVEVKHADSGIIHDLGRDADSNGKCAGHVDADVLMGQGPFQWDMDSARG